MKTRIKVVLLTIISSILRWVGIVASIIAIYCLIMIIWSDATWTQLFLAIGIGYISLWISAGLEGNVDRIIFENKLVKEGYSKEEAGKLWLKKYNNHNAKKTQENDKVHNIKENLEDFINDIKTYIKYCGLNPISIEEIRHASKLPIEKEVFLKKSLLYIEYLETDVQEILLEYLPLLAYYRDNIPENGYLSFYDKVLSDDTILEKLEDYQKKVSEQKEQNTELFEEISSEIYFPNDLLAECQNDSRKILQLLKNRIRNR